MNLVKMLGVAAFAALICTAVSPAQDKKIEMTRVKYDGLKQEIVKHRGKVVIVDFWATWCPNCIKAFPTFVTMQEKYGNKGLVVISVSVDDVTDKDKVEKANEILTKRKLPFRNLLLDEPTDFWPKKFETDSLPLYYVFDRNGKWVRFHPSQFKEDTLYVDLEKNVVQMLGEK